jgi:hypothetical protein
MERPRLAQWAHTVLIMIMMIDILISVYLINRITIDKSTAGED